MIKVPPTSSSRPESSTPDALPASGNNSRRLQPPDVISKVHVGLQAMRQLLWACPVLLGMTAAQPRTLPPFSHVFVIVLENTSAAEVLGNPNLPTLNVLAQQYGFATHTRVSLIPACPTTLLYSSGAPSAAGATIPVSASRGITSLCNWSAQGRPGRGTCKVFPGRVGTAPPPAPMARNTIP